MFQGYIVVKCKQQKQFLKIDILHGNKTNLVKEGCGDRNHFQYQHILCTLRTKDDFLSPPLYYPNMFMHI